MAKHMLVVLSNAVNGQDDTFNDWYTNTHLGDILKIPGYVGAQRLAASPVQLGSGDLPYKYLAIYEVEADDLAGAAKAMTSGAAGSMYISPALDRDRTVAWYYTPITDVVTAK